TAPICRSRKPASTKAAFARSMRARPFRYRAARASLSLPPPTATRTPHKLARSNFPNLTGLARLLVEPAPQQPDVADVGAEQDVECVPCDRHGADHALDCVIAQHPRRDVPGRAERACLAHKP